MTTNPLSTLNLTALNPSPQARANYAAGPAETALLRHFQAKFCPGDPEPGQARDPSAARTLGMKLKGWTAWGQFPLCSAEYRALTNPDPRPEMNPAEFDQWCREVLRDYADFLFQSGGARPAAPELRPSTS